MKAIITLTFSHLPAKEAVAEAQLTYERLAAQGWSSRLYGRDTQIDIAIDSNVLTSLASLAIDLLKYKENL